MRGIRTGIALIAGTLALSGCAVFQGTPTASQQKIIGAVAVHFTVCASNTGSSPPAGSCSNPGNSGNSDANYGDPSSDPSQLWLGFRIPTGAGAPTSFKSSSTGPGNTGPQLAFKTSQPYTNELQRLAPAAKGEMWVGYDSQFVNYNNSSGEQNFTATVDFKLPLGKHGAPFSGPFKYQLTVGGRAYSKGTTGPTLPARNEPIDCQESLTTGYDAFESESSGSSSWICVDDSSPSTVGTDATLATRDAGIVPGKQVTTSPGKKAHAKFKFKYAGPAPGASFKLKATASLHNGKPTASPAKITPTGTSSKTVTVTVHVPATAKPGLYKVKLTAKLPDGESRKGTDKLRVK